MWSSIGKSFNKVFSIGSTLPISFFLLKYILYRGIGIIKWLSRCWLCLVSYLCLWPGFDCLQCHNKCFKLHSWCVQIPKRLWWATSRRYVLFLFLSLPLIFSLTFIPSFFALYCCKKSDYFRMLDVVRFMFTVLWCTIFLTFPLLWIYDAPYFCLIMIFAYKVHCIDYSQCCYIICCPSSPWVWWVLELMMRRRRFEDKCWMWFGVCPSTTALQLWKLPRSQTVWLAFSSNAVLVLLIFMTVFHKKFDTFVVNREYICMI